MQSYFKKELLVGLSIVLGGILIFGAASLFLSLDVFSQSEKTAAARALIAERSAALEALAGLKQSAPEAARYKEVMNKVLVTENQLIDFPKWLDGLARGRNLALSFSFQGERIASSETLPAHIFFSMRIRGGLENIIDFLKEAEFQSPRFLVRLDGFSARRDGGDYDFSANGRVFYRE